MRRSVSALIAALLVAGLVAGCSKAPDSAVTLSVIGTEARAGNPDRHPVDRPGLVMTAALKQGLVQFDAHGDIEPALAERWMVTDDGLSYIFRIRRTQWADGTPVTAGDVAKSLRASLAATSQNPLRPLLTQIVQILPMTESVIEVRLSEPQPALLALLADPRMAITRNGQGSGPYRLYRAFPSAKILRPLRPSEEGGEESVRNGERRIRGERAALAIARYAERNAALVLGGDFATYPMIQAAGLPARDIRIDPVPGLFGLVPARDNGPAQNRTVRQAMAMSLDRPALLQRFGARGWAPSETLMPGPIDTYVQATPDWGPLSLAERTARARALISQTMGGRVRISIALPNGPGARLLFAQMAASWRTVGIDARLAAPGEAADFKLVDEVVPTGNALAYLLPFACTVKASCSAATSNALLIARRASRAERARLFAEADRAIIDEQLYIPLARPLRWSLVAPQLTGFATNPTGYHPLTQLGAPAP